MSFLTAGFGRPLSSSRSDLSDAVRQWGDMLTHSGCSLPGYVTTENQRLQSSPCSLSIHRTWTFEIVRLVLSERGELAIDIVDINARVPTFKARPIVVPGAWPSIWPKSIPDTLVWEPRPEDWQDGFTWVECGEFCLRSPRYQVKPFDMPHDDDEIYLASMVNELYVPRLREFKDDHTIEADARVQRPRAHEKQDRRLRRRAGSVPSLITHPTDGSTRHWGRDSTESEAWSTYKDTFCGLSSLRGFMQDGHDRYLPAPGAHGWERWLIWSKDHHLMARKYAERFLPHLVDIVDRVWEQATYPARLTMGPKRPEDLDM